MSFVKFKRKRHIYCVDFDNDLVTLYEFNLETGTIRIAGGCLHQIDPEDIPDYIRESVKKDYLFETI